MFSDAKKAISVKYNKKPEKAMAFTTMLEKGDKTRVRAIVYDLLRDKTKLYKPSKFDKLRDVLLYDKHTKKHTHIYCDAHSKFRASLKKCPGGDPHKAIMIDKLNSDISKYDVAPLPYSHSLFLYSYFPRNEKKFKKFVLLQEPHTKKFLDASEVNFGVPPQCIVSAMYKIAFSKSPYKEKSFPQELIDLATLCENTRCEKTESAFAGQIKKHPGFPFCIKL
jgi:hypothetical protein